MHSNNAGKKDARRLSGAAPKVIQINDHALGFYFGRGLTGESGYETIAGNWINQGAWDLGIANYVIYRNSSALLFDSSTSPECGFWIRDYLSSRLGIKDLTVVLSHWHLDHIAGLPAFSDCQIYALEETADCLRQNRSAIEKGTLWGPPGIQVVLPTKTFSDALNLEIGDIQVKLSHYKIHSHDGLAMLISSDRALYVGDMLEDTVSYIVEPAEIPTHLAELARLRQSDIDSIFPAHGSFARIAEGGYKKSLIDAVIEYNQNMIRYVNEADYLNLEIEGLIPDALRSGAVTIWENYRAVHRDNLRRVYEHWQSPAT